MASTVSFEIEGIDALTAKMEGLSYDLKRKGGRFALRKAANLIRDKAKEGAERLDDPETSRRIADNIVVRFAPREFRQTGNLVFRVGVLGGAKGFAAASGEVRGRGASNPGGDTYYWRFLEFGTEKIEARPFMRPALAESINAATREFVVQYGKSIDRALRKAAREAARGR